MSNVLVAYHSLVRLVALYAWWIHILEVLICWPLSFHHFAGHLVDYLRSSVGQWVINRIRCRWPVTHHVGDRPVDGVRQALNIGVIWPVNWPFTRVDWFTRLARLFRSDSNRAVSKMNSKGLTYLIIIVKDDFSAVSIVTYQSVAEASVSVDSRLGSVTRLSVSYAVKLINLQGFPGLVVNVSYASLLGISTVNNFNIFTWIFWIYYLIAYLSWNFLIANEFV